VPSWVGGELIVRVVINFFFLMIVMVLRLCLTKGIVKSRFGCQWCDLLGLEASLKGSMVVFAFE
jgi:hypothetical protein